MVGDTLDFCSECVYGCLVTDVTRKDVVGAEVFEFLKGGGLGWGLCCWVLLVAVVGRCRMHACIVQ